MARVDLIKDGLYEGYMTSGDGGMGTQAAPIKATWEAKRISNHTDNL